MPNCNCHLMKIASKTSTNLLTCHASQNAIESSVKMMRSKRRVLTVVLFAFALVLEPMLGQGQNTLDLGAFHLLPAPERAEVLLKSNDRLAICGDSITEQKMYSRIIEDYLTMCVPDLNVSVRQYGWAGEWAPQFLARMTNDCLRFQPTIATTSYGMNDCSYRPYEDSIGQNYRKSSTAIVEAFKAHGTRVILGSPGCVGKRPPWAKPDGTFENISVNLCALRNIDIAIANQEQVQFADVFWPMLNAMITSDEKYGTNYGFVGADGVHPHWAGHTVMAYAYLKAMGIKGEIGTFTVNLKTGKLTVSEGHEVISAKDDVFVIKSYRYPFCPCVGGGQAYGEYPICGQDDLQDDNSIRSGMSLVPFNQDLNRLILVAKQGKAAFYLVSWGNQSKLFLKDQFQAIK